MTLSCFRKHHIASAIFILFGFTSAFKAFAQKTDQTEDIAHYFNDNGTSERKFIVKFGALSAFGGDAPLLVEFPINKHISLEAGAGVLLTSYIPPFPGRAMLDFSKIDRKNGGYSLWLHPKHYYKQSYPESFYQGILIRKRSFEEDNTQIDYTDLLLNSGVQYLIRGRFVIDLQYGLGLRLPQNAAAERHSENFLMTLNLHLGIII